MISTLLYVVYFALFANLVAHAGQHDKAFVRGGQFKDLILPVPIIQGLEKAGLWGCEKVLPRDKDNGMEDNEWCYWGGNPVKGKDGKYHIAVCRLRSLPFRI